MKYYMYIYLCMYIYIYICIYIYISCHNLQKPSIASIQSNIKANNFAKFLLCSQSLHFVNIVLICVILGVYECVYIGVYTVCALVSIDLYMYAYVYVCICLYSCRDKCIYTCVNQCTYV